MASIETGLAAAAAKLSHQVGTPERRTRRTSGKGNRVSCVLQEEQQRTKKKKKSGKKKSAAAEEPPKHSQDSSSPDHNADSQEGSLTDHEFTTGTAKSPGGPQPMAPGIFLSQRRPSVSSPNNSTNSTSTNSSSATRADRLGPADAKGPQRNFCLFCVRLTK